MLEGYKRYMADVQSGKEVACKWVKLAVQRQADDLVRAKKKDFPYYFDEGVAGAVLMFLRTLRHVAAEWAGQPFVPADFQAFRFAVLFGWKHKTTGARRWRRAYLEVARKQGKSLEASAVALIGLLLDSEAKAQIFSAATTRDQARIVFEASQDMARRLGADSPLAGAMLEVFAHAVVNRQTGGKIAPLSSDAQKLDGHSPHIAIVDEYHEHPTNKVLKVLETGMGARRQPLSFIITTAGFNVEGPCYRLRHTATQILERNKVDETFFSIIYTLDEGDDWHDTTLWKKANPNIGVSPSWEYMNTAYTQATNEGFEAEVQFLTKNLNIWTTTSSTWIQSDVWDRGAEAIDDTLLVGRPCWGGLDLGEVRDFTAFTLCWPPDNEDGDYHFKWWFWYPEESAKQLNASGIPIYQWAQEGYIKITPGNVVDIEAVVEDIAALGSQHNILTVGMDPWGSRTNMLKFQELGMTVTELRQGFRTLSPLTKDFERFAYLGQIRHGNNPVMRWMLGNVELERDAAGNIKPSRKRKENKIDGVFSAILSLGEAQTGLRPVTSYLLSSEFADSP